MAGHKYEKWRLGLSQAVTSNKEYKLTNFSTAQIEMEKSEIYQKLGNEV